ncbi:MAG: hypothetical protein AAGJ87_15775, partial [Pseudomonadota bacterium]
MTETRRYLLAAALLFAGACSQGGVEPQGTEAASESAEPTSEERLDAAIAGAWRSDQERARDAFRNPKKTLRFFGVEPDMTVAEIWPGGGWYTNITAPYLASGGGVYIAAGLDPALSERAAARAEAFKETYGGKPELYGDVRLSVLGEEADIAPTGSADAVLTFRNVHNWMGREGLTEIYFDKFFSALKPGGVLGVVEHRADSADVDPRTGYVAEETVIAFAEAAGFEFEARSEINANPADTKDHPFGVWTLPPVRRSSATRGVDDPD